MKVRVAYVEEPPFYWTADDGSATGGDVELAREILSRIGATPEFVPTTFDELLPGVAAGRWELNVPIFVTPERAERVAFSRPVWALGDGFLVRAGNTSNLTGYSDVVAQADARLGVIPGQVQFDAARAAGVAAGQFVTFADQPAALASLVAGDIDAFAATAVGNRAIAADHVEFEAVDFPASGSAPVGAFSFRMSNESLIDSVNVALRDYLGTPGHRQRMAVFGLGASELDAVL